MIHTIQNVPITLAQFPKGYTENHAHKLFALAHEQVHEQLNATVNRAV